MKSTKCSSLFMTHFLTSSYRIVLINQLCMRDFCRKASDNRGTSAVYSIVLHLYLTRVSLLNIYIYSDISLAVVIDILHYKHTYKEHLIGCSLPCVSLIT